MTESELTESEISSLLDRFDQADPAVQRRIVARLVVYERSLRGRIAAAMKLATCHNPMGPCNLGRAKSPYYRPCVGCRIRKALEG
jgi:hypothetical protein